MGQRASWRRGYRRCSHCLRQRHRSNRFFQDRRSLHGDRRLRCCRRWWLKGARLQQDQRATLTDLVAQFDPDFLNHTGCGGWHIDGHLVGFRHHERVIRQVERNLNDFESVNTDYAEVMECYLMTGDFDYLIRVVVADMPALERFIVDKLTKIPGISNIKSSFALKQVKYKTALPL